LAVTIGLTGGHLRRTLRNAPDNAAWWRAAGGTAALAAFGAHSLVDMTMMAPAIMLLTLSILAASLNPPMRRPAANRLLRLLPLGLWIAILGSGWWSAQVYSQYEQGQRQIVAGDYQRAAETLRHAANKQPFIALYHAEYGYACGLAAFYGNDSSLNACTTAYERALDLEKPHAVWWANLAALRWQAGDSISAIDAMRQAVTFASDYPDFWLNLGIFYEGASQSGLAQAAYGRALEIDPLWGQSTFWTETPLRRQTRAYHRMEPALYQQALALRQAGKLNAGVSLLKASIDHDPTQPQPYLDIARLYLVDGQSSRAQNYLDAAKLLNHNDIDRARWYAAAALMTDDQTDYLDRARALVLPDTTGVPLFHYGRNIAYFHFLRVTVKGTLLPQLRVLGPDPTLVEALR
jgi:tetratricopeptide (TPR) repeat protein